MDAVWKARDLANFHTASVAVEVLAGVHHGATAGLNVAWQPGMELTDRGSDCSFPAKFKHPGLESAAKRAVEVRPMLRA